MLPRALAWEFMLFTTELAEAIMAMSSAIARIAEDVPPFLRNILDAMKLMAHHALLLGRRGYVKPDLSPYLVVVDVVCGFVVCPQFEYDSLV